MNIVVKKAKIENEDVVPPPTNQELDKNWRRRDVGGIRWTWYRYYTLDLFIFNPSIAVIPICQGVVNNFLKIIAYWQLSRNNVWYIK